MLGIALIGIVIYVFFCLISYDSTDPVFSFFQLGYPVNHVPSNFGGIFGARLSAVMLVFFGGLSYLGLLFILLYAWSEVWNSAKFSVWETVGGICFFLALAGFLNQMRSSTGSVSSTPYPLEGLVGILAGNAVGRYFGQKGGLFLLGVSAVGLLVASSRIFLLPFEDLFKLFSRRDTRYVPPALPVTGARRQIFGAKRAAEKLAAHEDLQPLVQEIKEQGIPEEEQSEEVPPPDKKESKPRKSRALEREPSEKKTMAEKTKVVRVPGVPGEFHLPPLSLLKIGKQTEKETEEDLQGYAQVIEETLSDFGIEGEIVRYTQGPRVTLYELQPAPGIPLSKITKLADNIAMSLKATSIRMVAPLPGRSTIGIEVPNREISIVYLREMLESREFLSAPSKLTMAIGKNILGKPVISDLKIMPHLLIAGTTGSGKTVCLNSLITSILYKASPDEVKFLMIDPKRVELVPYADIPHLLLPIITDSKKAVSALKWLIWEMEKRYQQFSKAQVRNIESFNIEADEKLPYIVVVVDELADLMMIARNEIENSIIRLTQLARASGIHLILATQRPSVDVITGLIKANLPCRISFQVATKFDSQTILDARGAEKLLGRGDLLFLPPGKAHPIRAQGCFMTDEELEAVTGYLKQQREPEYRSEILQQEQEAPAYTGQYNSEDADLYAQAVRIVLETKIASISMLQRRLGIGFNRAARFVEQMEAEGIVGPYREGKPRLILKGTPGNERSDTRKQDRTDKED